MRRALGGPANPAVESLGNSHARNSMFELFLAADWKVRGLSVTVGEPDIELSIKGSRILTECKRPFSKDSVASNIEEAASQIRRHLDRPENASARGLIVISLTRVITGNILMVEGPEGKKAVTEKLIDYLAEHEKEWRVYRRMTAHPRIVAAMFHLAVPWDIGSESLIYMASERFCLASNGDAQGSLFLTSAFLDSTRQQRRPRMVSPQLGVRET